MTQTYSEIIEELAEKGNIAGLMDMAEHGDKKTLAAMAVEALGQLKADQAVGLLLFQAVTGKCWAKVRDAAILALGEIGNPIVVNPLSKLLEARDNVEEGESPFIDDYLGEKVLTALGVMSNKGNAEALWSIINVLDSHWATPALEVLKGLGDKAADNLIGLLDSKNGAMAKKAVIALGEIGSKKATQPLATILAKYSEDDYELLEEVVRALGKIKDRESVKPLFHALKPNSHHEDKDYGVQNLLIIALGDIGDNRACKPLLQLLLNAEEYRIRWTSAYALAKIGGGINDDEIIKQLVSLLGSERGEESVRQLIAWTLLQVDEESISLPLLNYLKNNMMGMLKQALFADPDVKT